MANPDVVVRDLIGAAGGALAYYVQASTLFRGPPRQPSGQVPHRSAWVTWYDSPPKMDTFDGGGIRSYSVQVMLRGNVDDLATIQADAVAMRDALHHADVSAAGFMRCAVASGPAWVGLDDTEHPLISLNLLLWEDT